ncbi:MAG: phosphoribosylanthranilate isomerase [Coriobacteriia bacterium]|nr:phosphoribosylanthranilate isomerase [Coriobacteriia bacterium]
MRNVRTRVKVCGLASAVDAAEAVRAGADALGVVLAESPRQVTLTEAEEIFATIPPFVARVGVFVDAPVDYVERAVARLNLAAVQFHGSESAECCAAAPAPVIKALRVRPEFDAAEFDVYRGTVAALLFDTYVEGVDGGTGRTFPWQSASPLPSWVPVIVAGGLNPVNVGGAIRTLGPYGVDVSSGVEERLRQKDQLKLHAFVAAVRAADEEVRQ